MFTFQPVIRETRLFKHVYRFAKTNFYIKTTLLNFPFIVKDIPIKQCTKNQQNEYIWHTKQLIGPDMTYLRESLHSEWSEWSSCSQTCGNQGFKSRQRKYNQQLPGFEFASHMNIEQRQACVGIPCESKSKN